MGGELTELFNLAPDEDELDSSLNQLRVKKRKKATSKMQIKIAFISALLGMSFPSGIVADMLNLDRSSVDDIYDATEDAYKKFVSKPLNTDLSVQARNDSRICTCETSV